MATKRLSVTNTANLFVFIFSLGVIFNNLAQNRTNLITSFSILIRETNTHSSTFFFLIFAFGIIIPFFLYIFKLFLSMASVENHIDRYNQYIGNLSKPLLIFENFIRFLICISFLFLAADSINWAPKFLNFIFNGLIIDKISFGYNDLYAFSEINGFPSLKPLLSFNLIFFIVLLIWDLIVFIGNFKKNSKGFKEQFLPFWDRFIEHHFLGLILWGSLVILLLTKNGLLFLREWNFVVYFLLGGILVVYIISLYKSLIGLKDDFKYLFIY